MKRDDEHRIVRTMNSLMQAKGWSPLALYGLPISYCKERAVTPYFFCSDVSLRPSGQYAIEGIVGVICQAFETLWLQNEGRTPKAPGFGVLLNILNLPKLQQKRYITIDSQLEVHIDGFCTTLVDILAELPHDEHELISTLERGELCGFPLKSFSGYAYRSKFDAFWEFVSRLQKSR